MRGYQPGSGPWFEDSEPAPAPAPGKRTLTMQLQRSGGMTVPAGAAAEPAELIDDALAGPADPLPYLAELQRSFGSHDLGDVRAHDGADATRAAASIGAQAFATGADVVFARPPTLHTVAHEAAHVVQQRSGGVTVQGLGAEDDEHERHADRVADAVVRGESVEALLDRYAAAGDPTAPRRAVQRMPVAAADRDESKEKPDAGERALFARLAKGYDTTTLGLADCTALLAAIAGARYGLKDSARTAQLVAALKLQQATFDSKHAGDDVLGGDGDEDEDEGEGDGGVDDTDYGDDWSFVYQAMRADRRQPWPRKDGVERKSRGPSASDLQWLTAVGQAVGGSAKAGAIAQELYRAAAVAGIKNVFGLKPTEAAAVLGKHRAPAASSGSGSHAAQRRAPVVPLAGFVQELVEHFGIPLAKVQQLQAPAQAYVRFHADHATWTASQAAPRIAALKEMAALLNLWSEQHQAPELYRGPSAMQSDTAKSPLAGGEQVGVAMRALLTLDPGDLVGYEPEESQTWALFSKRLGGYVRAHLLNKHVGGHGGSQNVGFLSAADNTRMSEGGEEAVKRRVLEDNQPMFYRVDFEMGRPELGAAPHFVRQAHCALVVKTVTLTAQTVTPAVADDGGTDVVLKPALMAAFKTTPPDPVMLGRIQERSTDRIAEAKASTQSGMLHTMMMAAADARLVNQLHAELLAAGSAKARTAIAMGMESKLSGLPELQRQEVLYKLGEVHDSTGAIERIDERHESKAAKNAAKPARAEFIRAHGLGPGVAVHVNEASDDRFKKMQAAVALGVPASEAVKKALELDGKDWSAYLDGVRARNKGTDVMSLFAAASKKGPDSKDKDDDLDIYD